MPNPQSCAHRRALPVCRASLVVSLSLSAPAWGQSSESEPLEAVTVTGARAQGLRPTTVEAGTFRGSDIMEVPSTVNVVTRELLELQGATGLYDAVRNTAGVTRQQNGGDSWDQLVIRGIPVENRTNYRLNGSVPIMNFSQVPLENKERVEILKGASAVYYGFTSPAGIVNFVTKRAGATPVTTVGVSFDEYGTALATIDVGRRFGSGQQYGVRINAAGGSQGSYLDDVGSGNRRFGSAALDWRVTDRLLVRTDFEYDHRNIIEQAGVALPPAVNGVITLPHPVDARELVGPAFATFRTEAANAAVRADYSFDDDWGLTLEAGHTRTARDRTLPIFTFTSAATVGTGAGSIRGNIQHQVTASNLVRAELFGRFALAGLRNEVTVGVGRTTKSQDPIFQRNYTVAAQNLYDPVAITRVVYGAAPTVATTAGLRTSDLGVYALDRIELTSQWQVYGGVRNTRYRSDQGALHYEVGETTPMGALVYRATPTLSFYTSYAKGVEEGQTAPTGTGNQNTKLAPGVSRQKEIGARWLAVGDTLLSAAVYDIDRPGSYTNTSNVFVGAGTQNYKGIEVSTQGKLTPQLAWQTSAQLLNPTFRGIGPAQDGRLPENAAKKTASAFLSYDLAFVPGWSVNGGAYYTGRRPVNDQNQAFLGGITLFAVGARYTTDLFGRHATWQVNVENLGDREYWAGAGTRLSAGAPRAIRGSLKLDL